MNYQEAEQKKGMILMKIRMLDRVLLVLYTILIIFLSLGLVCIALNIIPLYSVVNMISRIKYGWPFALILLGIALAMILVSFRLLLSGFRSSDRKPLSTILNTTELGIIRISINTLDTLTQKAVHKFQEVKEGKSVILPVEDGGIKIQLKITILPDVPMPELSQNIQSKVKEYVEEMSGITVKEVQIYIDNLSTAKQNRVE
jgi:uncharacterized alkaline shock family protein YloU